MTIPLTPDLLRAASRKEHDRVYREKHAERIKETNRAYREKHAERIKEQRQTKQGFYRRNSRKKHLLKTYGLTIDDYNQLLARQNGHCFFCKRTEGKPGSNLYVDHDHATGRVRGLLCYTHNNALGVFGDDVKGLQKALEYTRGVD